MNDIRFGLSPILNVSGVDTEVALARAATCERVHIAIERVVGNSDEPVSIPVRIIEGMGNIAARGYVSEEQMPLMEKLFALLSSCEGLQSLRV